MQGYSLCLLGNQLKFQLQPFGCKRARATMAYFESDRKVPTIAAT